MGTDLHESESLQSGTDSFIKGNTVNKRGRLFLITGDPGSGKTTVLNKVIFDLKSRGYIVGGVLTREIRSHGDRRGFNLLDLSTEEYALLASDEGKLGPRVGRYHVDLNTLARLGVKALKHAALSSDLVVCDEVGPMELFSPEFRKAIRETVLNSTKPSLCVVHKRLTDPLIDEIKSQKRSKIFEVTFENRDEIREIVTEEVLDFLEEEKRTL